MAGATSVPAPVGDPLAFYEIAATIIPVLFLALIYQANAARFIGLDAGIAVVSQIAGVLLAPLWGEITCLHVLSTRIPTTRAHEQVTIALSATGALLAYSIFVQLVKPKAGASTPQATKLGFVITIVVGILGSLRAAEVL